MEGIKNFINIFWIISQKVSEEIISYLTLENVQKIQISPIYISKDIKQNYILSVFIYVSEKKNNELIFYSEFVKDKVIKYDSKLLLELEDKKDEYLFLYDFINLEGISSEMKFELYLKMIDDKYKGFMKENLFNNTKILFLNDENCDFILYISLFVEGYNIKDFIKNVQFVILCIKGKN